MKRIPYILFLILLLAFTIYQVWPVSEPLAALVSDPVLVNKDSTTIASRVNLPKGYKRVAYP